MFGLTMFFDFRDNPVWWTKRREELEHTEKVFELLTSFKKGTVWDVGANVGLFALRATSLGHRVVAFDISGKALDLLQRSAKTNGFTITTVKRAFSTHSFRYHEPRSADTENAISEVAAGECQSITFFEAERDYGRPTLLKMDIEGGELDFIKSLEFKQWILSNRIPWVVEFHSPKFKELLWQDCNFTLLDESHYGLNLEHLK